MEPNCDEKMVVISNEWPQTHIHDKRLMLSTSKLMEKLGQDISQQQHQQQQHQQQQQQSQQQALKCPRCDSSNTKFCYYNNYSLSQPRHFCKACKRYWTRGGTLRNVPVGGGCRKNKRVKRSSSSSNSEGTNNISQVSNIANPNSTLSSHNQPQVDINHLFYGLPTNPSDLNRLQLGGRLGSRSVDTVSGSGFQLPPQLNHLALGFSSGVQNGVVFGSPSSTTTTTTPSLATLLASSIHSQQNKLTIKDSIRVPNQFYSLTPFEDLQMSCESGNISTKDHVKSEQEQSRFDNWNLLNQNQTDQMSFSSSESLLYWNPNQTSVVGAWHDPARQSLL